MQFFKRLLTGRAPREAQATAPRAAHVAAMRQLLSRAVRDALHAHGIPPAWIAADAVDSLGARELPRMHVRLTVLQSHPALMDHAISLQRDIAARLARQDAASAAWFAGVTWKFKLGDDAAGASAGTAPAAGEGLVAAPGNGPASAPSPRQVMALRMQRNDAAWRGACDDFTPTTPMCLPEAGR